MPNVDKPELINGVLCGPTHHLACDCREAYIKKLEKVREAAINLIPEALAIYTLAEHRKTKIQKLEQALMKDSKTRTSSNGSSAIETCIATVYLLLSVYTLKERYEKIYR